MNEKHNYIYSYRYIVERDGGCGMVRAKFRVRGRQGGCNQSDRVWSWMGMLRDEPKASPAAPSRRRVRPRLAEGESGRLLAVTSRRRVAAPLAPQAIF